MPSTFYSVLIIYKIQGNLTWQESRRCDYTGLYYCSACHWGSSAVIPARVLHNWDLSPYPVSQASLQQLRITAGRPLLNIEKLNPKLFNVVLELNLVKKLRNELNGIRKYLLVCRIAQEDHLLWKSVDTPHLIESPDLYSLQNLVDTQSGELPSKLHNLVSVFTKHVKEECLICHGRGHICEVCSNEEVIFPFESSSFICPKCKAVLHKTCFERIKSECPKCVRLKGRMEKIQIDNDCHVEVL